MARIIPLSEVLQMDADEIIVCTTGTLKKVHGWKTGKNAKGDWSLQNCVIEKDGTELSLFLANRAEELPKTWQGREVLIEAHKGDKGWSGVYAMDDDYNGKSERKIKVTATGDISLVGGDPKPAPPENKPQRQPEPKPEPKEEYVPKTLREEPEPPKKSRMSEAVEYAIQAANLSLLCINTVEQYIVPRIKETLGVDMDAQARHAWAMNMRIDMQKKGYENAMPKSKMKGTQPKPQPKPQHQAEPAPAPQAPPPAPPDDPTDTGEPRDKDGNYLF